MAERPRRSDPDSTGTNPSSGPSFRDVLEARLDRRRLLLAGLAAGPALAAGPLLGSARAAGPARFPEIAHGVDGTHHVAPDHEASVLIRWGDPVLPGAPPFDPGAQTAAAQAQQFGYNNDYIGFLPLDAGGRRGLLCVNHEYSNEEVMFPEAGTGWGEGRLPSRGRAETEMAAHGGSVVEVRRGPDGWRPEPGPYSRRITASTPMEIAGPAAGDPRMRTAADPGGRRVLGMVNNCAGGMTPWGTWLSAEENFNLYFAGDASGRPDAESLRRYGVPAGWYHWGLYDPRFDVGREPNEPNRFGWVVEIDPLDPASTPRKRTALGRFKHEGAETIVNGDGRVAVYMGDDARFDYLYRFVSRDRFDPADPESGRDLLDHGTLSVARFDPSGTLAWLPLVFGEGPLTPENGFANQADVLIRAREAGDALGATPMDRPEDVQPNPVTGKVYVVLTNNRKRRETDAVHRRAGNRAGLVVELSPPGGDHAAPSCGWDILVEAGDPDSPGDAASWNPGTSENGWFASPDNAAVDPQGRLWIASDQGRAWPEFGTADGLWALETEGPGRGTGRMFFRCPVGAEACGPAFTPDGRTLFLAVQHPGTDGVRSYPGFRRDSTFLDPATRWPDFRDGMPPRPSVVAVRRKDGGPVGG